MGYDEETEDEKKTGQINNMKTLRNVKMCVCLNLFPQQCGSARVHLTEMTMHERHSIKTATNTDNDDEDDDEVMRKMPHANDMKRKIC